MIADAILLSNGQMYKHSTFLLCPFKAELFLGISPVKESRVIASRAGI